MANPWFRLYSEFSHDPKVQMMSESMQRRYIMLMCLRCSNNLVTLHEEEVAFHLRISNADLAETRQLFLSKGFIDESWNLLNWEKRQSQSDSSSARVAKHRALQKAKQAGACNGDVTLQKRKSNALDKIREDKNKHPSSAPDGFDLFWQKYPKKVGKPAAQRAFKAARLNGHLPEVIGDIEQKSNSDGWTKNGGQFIPNPATYLNQRRWEDEESRTEESMFAGAI